MGRKGLVTSIFSKLVDTSPSSSPNAGGGGGDQLSPQWPWPSSCGNNPQTTSFRAGDEPCCTTAGTTTGAATAMSTARRLNQLRGAAAGEMYKTVNSVYFDSAVDDYFSLDAAEDGKEEEVVDDDESCFSTTTASEQWSEAVIRSLGRSTSTHRFFFDPGPPSINSTLTASAAAPSPPASPPPKPDAAAGPDDPEHDLDLDDDGEKQQQQQSTPVKSLSSLAEGSVAVAVDSSDPFGDFRASMEEMVAAHGLRDWAALEELLSWYLRVNGKQHHPLIVGAFVDMLIGLASSPPSTTTTTTTTTTATTTISSSGKSTQSSTTCTCSATSITATKRGHRGANEASCSSSSSCAAPDEAEEKASDPSASDDDDRIQRHECEQHERRST